MKKFLSIVLSISMMVGIVACSEDKTSESDKNSETTQAGQEQSDPLDGVDTSTVSGSIYASFVEELGKTDDLNVVAEAIADESVSGYACMVTDMVEGYFPGFDSDITGFNKAVGVAPMIGSIPFVCYIFDVDDAESFASNLESHADPRWNICTEADETLVKTNGNTVFFIMCPAE